jgi:hypothetical protein
MSITGDQFLSIIRGFLNIGGGVLVTHGVVSGGSMTTISGIVLNIASLAWGAFVHSDPQVMKAAEIVQDRRPDL